jgi:hypothetical protein
MTTRGFAIAATVLGFTLLALSFAKWTTGRARRYSLRTAAVLLLYIAFIIGLEDPGRWWCWLFAAIPAVLVAQQVLYLTLVRRPFQEGIESEDERNIVARFSLDRFMSENSPEEQKKGIAVVKQAAADSERYFSAASMLLRLGLPGLVTVIMGAMLARMLCLNLGDSPTSPHVGWVLHWIWVKYPQILRGLRYGLAGAYVFVLLHLARRNFRHDITNGAVVWCMTTVAIGPLLSATVALLWGGQAMSGFGPATVLFMAGFAPRYVTQTLSEVARRMIGGGAANTPVRLLPLTTIRGITADISDRLEEEGIEDAYALAMSDASRLLRSTYFDERQIIAWIDEALMITNIPAAWQKLEEQGITGAIDLAWYADAEDSELAGLAQRVGLDAHSLRDVAQRLSEDRQVQLLWVLYQGKSENEDGKVTEIHPPEKVAA